MVGVLLRHVAVALACAVGALAFAALAEPVIARVFPTEPVLVCTPTVVMLVLDRSGSMSEDPDDDKMLRVQDAIGRFADRARHDVCVDDLRVGLVTFAREARLDVAPTTDLGELESVARSVVALGGTIIENGIDLATAELRREDLATWRKLVFILTDAENHDSDAESLAPSLRGALVGGAEVTAIVTEEGDHIDVFRHALGPDSVLLVEDMEIGETFFTEAAATVFRASIIVPERHFLATAAWTSLVTAGIALALIMYHHHRNKRKRLLIGRDLLAVLAALLLGLAIGALVQYLPSLAVFAPTAVGQVDGERGLFADVAIWTTIGLLLTVGLASFRIVPNRRILHAIGFGLVGGAVAGLAYGLLSDVTVAGDLTFVPRLAAAAALGGVIGWAFSLFSETSVQYPIWLRVHYVSDAVNRYHPLGKTPLTVGGGSGADVYVHSEHPVVWRFWVERDHVVVDNVVAGKRRSLPFAEVARRGAMELAGMQLKIVDDVGPEKGRATA
jgi:uncharacterized protein YegL